MNRPVVQLHTIDQWMAYDPAIRTIILQNIRLKDRLYRYLLRKRDEPRPDPTEVACRKCKGTGRILIEPRYDGIHPSQIPSTCLLKIFNDMVGQDGKTTHEPRLLLIFDLGTAVHKMFQGYGEDGAWGPLYEKEAEISGNLQQLAADLMIEGHADADNILIIDDIPNAPIFEVGLVHEYKSINDAGFQKLTRPKPEHKMQAMLYSAALNRPIVVYLYLNKNDSNIADFPVAFEPDLWAQLYHKASTLKRHYDAWETATASGQLPVLPPADTGFHCQDCQYSFNCEPYKEHLKGRRK